MGLSNTKYCMNKTLLSTKFSLIINLWHKPWLLIFVWNFLNSLSIEPIRRQTCTCFGSMEANSLAIGPVYEYDGNVFHQKWTYKPVMETTNQEASQFSYDLPEIEYNNLYWRCQRLLWKVKSCFDENLYIYGTFLPNT